MPMKTRIVPYSGAEAANDIGAEQNAADVSSTQSRPLRSPSERDRRFKHPQLKVGVKQLIYKPMVELLRYLEDNEFRVYIFTADEGAFLRLAAMDLYGLPPSRVFGTSVRSEWVVERDQPLLVRTYRLEQLNNWDGKPRLIQQVIGKPPIFAAGNSDGDQHMLQFAALSGGMAVLVRHTDDERELAYTTHTDKVMPLARKEGWTVIDMKLDWKTIFPNQ